MNIALNTLSNIKTKDKTRTKMEKGIPKEFMTGVRIVWNTSPAWIHWHTVWQAIAWNGTSPHMGHSLRAMYSFQKLEKEKKSCIIQLCDLKTRKMSSLLSWFIVLSSTTFLIFIEFFFFPYVHLVTAITKSDRLKDII